LVLLVIGGVTASWWGYGYWKGHRFDRLIGAAAGRYGVEPALVKAVVWQESRFRPHAVGRAGEIGLMQIRELAAVEWSTSQGVLGFELDHLFAPATNTLAGTWYLARLLKRYARTDDPLPYALADYNAGRGHVLRWNQGAAETNATAFLGQISFPGTRKYVENVVRRRAEYQLDFPDRE
jgi:soluble lytic murein transglycosylase